MPDQEPTAEQVIEAVYGYATELAKANMPAPEIEQRLVDKGLERDDAARVVKNLFDARSRVLKEVGRKNMLYGALWCVGGMIVTLVTYDASSKAGGSYFVAWGAVLFGAIQFIRGLVQVTKS